IAVLCALAAVLALRSLHRMLADAPTAVDVVLVVLGIAALLPLVPAVRAFAHGRSRARLMSEGRLAAARHEAAAGREHSHTAMGYALAVLLSAALVWFVTANDGAIATPFLRWEFLKSRFVNVTKAFWVNLAFAVG